MPQAAQFNKVRKNSTKFVKKFLNFRVTFLNNQAYFEYDNNISVAKLVFFIQ